MIKYILITAFFKIIILFILVITIYLTLNTSNTSNIVINVNKINILINKTKKITNKVIINKKITNKVNKPKKSMELINENSIPSKLLDRSENLTKLLNGAKEILEINSSMNFLISSDSIKIIGAPKRDNNYAWFNPFIIYYKSVYLVSVRESTEQRCPYIKDRPKIIKNKIIFGVGDSIYNFKYAGMIDNHLVSSYTIFQGLEDARLFTYYNDSKLGMLTINNYRLYISELNLSISKNNIYNISELKRKKINYSSISKEKWQKNWVRLPNEQIGEDPHFISYLNPLTIIKINVDSGIASLVYKENKTNKNIYNNLRGNTNFIKISTDLYLGIAHRKIQKHYFSVFLTIKKYDYKYKIESFSNCFKAPIFDENMILSNQYRIHFPMSLSCYDKLNCSIFLVSLGIMDCQSFFALYNRSVVMNDMLIREI